MSGSVRAQCVVTGNPVQLQPLCPQLLEELLGSQGQQQAERVQGSGVSPFAALSLQQESQLPGVTRQLLSSSGTGHHGVLEASWSKPHRLSRSVSVQELHTLHSRDCKVRRGAQVISPEASVDGRVRAGRQQSGRESSSDMHSASSSSSTDTLQQALQRLASSVLAAESAASAYDCKLHKGEAMEGRVRGGKLLHSKSKEEPGNSTSPLSLDDAGGSPHRSPPQRLLSLDSCRLAQLDRSISICTGRTSALPSDGSSAVEVVRSAPAEGRVLRVRPSAGVSLGSLASATATYSRLSSSQSFARADSTLFELAEEQVGLSSATFTQSSVDRSSFNEAISLSTSSMTRLVVDFANQSLSMSPPNMGLSPQCDCALLSISDPVASSSSGRHCTKLSGHFTTLSQQPR